MPKLIFGCGYLGRRVAERWVASGEEVFAVTRSAERASNFEQAGLRPIVADVTDLRSLAGLPEAETVLYAVGYDRAAGKSLSDVYVQGLANVLDALPRGIGRLIYISSTGVYGQADGQWVDEDSPCHPQREGGRACLAAERIIAGHPLGTRTVILRMAGIYGPGRIPRSADLVAGKPIAAPAEGYLNLIHVEDAAEIVLLSERRAKPPRTYIVADGHPVVRRKYFAELARLLAAPSPTFEPAPPDSPAAERASADKRMRTLRLMSELRPVLRYPSYQEGLAAIMRKGSGFGVQDSGRGENEEGQRS